MTTENTTLYSISATYKYNDVDYPLNFKADLNISEMGALVQQVTNNIVDEDGYYPYLHDYALYSGILSVFSDFNVTDIMEIDNILKHSNIIDVISESAYNYGDIVCFVDENIEYQKQKYANKSEFDGLISDLRSVFNKEIFNKLSDKINYIVDNIEPEVIVKCVNKFSDSKMTPKDLVSALCDMKFINKDLPKKKNVNKPGKGKVINFAGQQTFDGNEVKTDSIE